MYLSTARSQPVVGCRRAREGTNKGRIYIQSSLCLRCPLTGSLKLAGSATESTSHEIWVKTIVSTSAVQSTSGEFFLSFSRRP